MQVIHRELVAEGELVGLGPVPDLLDGAALLPLLGGVPHKQPLAQGGAQGVHSVQLPLRVLLTQLLHRQLGGLEGGRQTGGESQYQHVPASLEQGLDGLHILVHVDCGGGSHLAGTEALVEEMGVHLPVVGVVVVDRFVHLKAEGQDLNAQIPDHIGTEIGRGVSKDHKV